MWFFVRLPETYVRVITDFGLLGKQTTFAYGLHWFRTFIRVINCLSLRPYPRSPVHHLERQYRPNIFGTCKTSIKNVLYLYFGIKRSVSTLNNNAHHYRPLKAHGFIAAIAELMYFFSTTLRILFLS